MTVHLTKVYPHGFKSTWFHLTKARLVPNGTSGASANNAIGQNLPSSLPFSQLIRIYLKCMNANDTDYLACHLKAQCYF